MSRCGKYLLEEIGRNSQNFLINANYYAKAKFGISSSNAAFRLITNTCQPEFLSLWKIFDFNKLFQKTVEELSREVLGITANKRCSAIVTGSPVSWRLLEYIHPLVEQPRLINDPTFAISETQLAADETSAGEELLITYLGPHGGALRGESTSRLAGNGVLLFTDVIGRRGSVLATARLIERFGGDCIAIVAPVLISPDLILSEILSGQRPTLRIPDRTSDPIRVHSLCHFPIREMAGSDDMQGLVTLEELFLSDDGATAPQDDGAGAAALSDHYLQRALAHLKTRLVDVDATRRTRFAQFLADGLELAFERSFSVVRPGDQSILELDCELHHPHCAPHPDHDPNTCSWHWRRQILELKNAISSGSEGGDVSADMFGPCIRAFLENFFVLCELALDGLAADTEAMPGQRQNAFIETCLERFDSHRGFRTALLSQLAGSAAAPGQPVAEIRRPALLQATFELFCSFQHAAYDPNAVVRIDPLTNYPGPREFPWPMPGPIKPRFSASEMFEMFENCELMNFGFYRWDQRALMSAFRLPRLFEAEGSRLWEAIKTLPLDKRSLSGAQTIAGLLAQNGSWTIATTVGFGDIQFRDFFISQAEKDGFELANAKSFSLPRKDVIGSSSHNYFVPEDIEGALKHRHVLLLVSETYSAATVRELLATLVRYEVASINVVCLISRMNHRESEFVARMSTLAAGGQTNGHGAAAADVPIYFQSLFNIPEFSNEDIQRMQSDTTAVFTQYERKTKVPVYQRLVTQYDKYFRSKEVTSASFAAGATLPLAAPETVECLGENVTVKSEEGKLLALCASLISEGKYEPIIELLHHVSNKAVLFKLIAILMGDIRYLRVTGRTRTLYETIDARLAAERAKRLAAEPDPGQTIQSAIANEVHIILGLVLLAFYDHVDVRAAASKFLSWGRCDLSIAEIEKNPNNAIAFFSDERVGWVTSMLLHSGLSNYPHDDRYKGLRAELIAFVQSLMRYFGQLKGAETGPDESVQKAMTTLHLFLSDLGVYDIRRKVDVLRYLHSRLITDTTNHNPIRKDLDRVKRQLGAPRDPIRQEEHTRFSLAFWVGEHQQTVQEFQSELSAAIRLSGELELIASALIRLFEFSPLAKDKAGDFAVQNDESNFSRRVQRFAFLLERARVENRLSFAEASEIIAHARLIQNWLFDPVLSPLRRVLGWYMAPLRRMLLQAGAAAEEKLNAQFGPVWKRELDKVAKDLETEGEIYVLCLDSFLKEVLENAFSNAKHAFAGETPGAGFSERVGLELVIDSSGTPIIGAAAVLGGVEQPRYIDVKFHTYGQTIMPAGVESRASTINRHAREIEDYGGDFTYRSLEKNGSKDQGTTFLLRLVSRTDVRARMDRDPH